ncbi:MAG: thioredoxin reductase [Candidatus Hepatoplasma vulgare]|nr:MAG: thioredoxin reductase [Candidatus Hepatoplasma sp.]
MKVDYDVVILGAGPAGLTASIYLSRLSIDNLIIENSVPGGKLLNTFRVENYTGIIGKTGSEIAIDFLNHAKKLGAKILIEEIEKIDDLDKEIKIIYLKDKKIIKTRIVIIATGLTAKKLEINDYNLLFGKGIHTCLICDAPFYKGEKIAVIGGGNSALEESIFAINFVDKLNIVNITNEPTAFEYITKELKENKNVEIYNNSVIKKINHLNGNIKSIIIEDSKTKKEREIKVSGIFTYIGWIPNTSFLPFEILNKNKYIIVDKNNKTKIKGVFAAGDVIEKKYRQLVIATSDGAIAALEAKKYLEENK